MYKWLVYVNYIDNPDVYIQGLINAKDKVDANQQAFKILLLAKDIINIDVDDSQPFESDDLYLTDIDATPTFNINKDLNIELEYYQILTKKIKPDNKYLDKLISHFEIKEHYEKCAQLVKIKD